MAEDLIYDRQELREQQDVFADRAEAGAILADLVAELALPNPLVLAIPAGGLPVAVPVAESLHCPLDVAVVSKIVLPWNSEAGYGAVAFDGSYRLNHDLVQGIALNEEEVERGITATRAKVARRVDSLRGQRPFPDLAAHDIVVVDDGLASGFTMLTAIDALRRTGAGQIGIAVPTGLADTVRRLAGEVDWICCANLRSRLPFAVASAYRRWRDVAEAEAAELFRLHR